ncbi:preprotein translocase subunit SecE [Desulfurispirillum indicum]|uniref:Protein translocase subunit SecE n=1 Tax=Desulfurispirillum indicum (strain ATCC BAA-1389 / DSM 22839 / S5) TaxID=653733 RepID=E6W250_DESIS|nr:preprotein translocase subunit SecE [Desulfurispirillum indicum]ADU66676.1 preprotein translocase, SecE subunit [Desulfurispirillum indicum S5]UCZ55994.1 preprotein translocase subunit SecE [Desulfurispirillum indicum]
MKTVEFLKSVKSEFGKVVWPKKDEVKGMTLVVLVLVAFMTVYFGALDAVFSRMISLLIG